ncbi:MAG: hypothetical protein AAB665_04200 [Patescibacteria group bacterium]
MQEVLSKLREHDKNFEQIAQQFESVDKRFESVDKRFESVDKRFDQIDGQIDFIVKKVLEHDGRFERIEENMATKEDVSKMTNTLDRIVKLVETKDQESALMAYGLRNVEEKVEGHDRDIKKMKIALELS